MKALTEKWEVVEKTALSLGVNEEALRKWRERQSIPGRWHMQILTASKGKLKPSDFLEAS